MTELIKNVVFDLGNVLVRWDPQTVMSKHFPNHPDLPALTKLMFKADPWIELNLGKITELQAVEKYQRLHGYDFDFLQNLIADVKESLSPVPNSFELLDNLIANGYHVYGLTDNTHEVMAYLKSKYNFIQKFRGCVVSAEVGYLKPAPQIYQHLLETYHLVPAQTVFMDDLQGNIEGARKMGMHGIQFHNTEQCIQELQRLGVRTQ